MSADISVLQNIKALIARLASPEGKVSNVAYTQKAYDDNDIEGVTEYNFNQEQNIPTQASIPINVMIKQKGFRAQGASIPRDFMNHLAGRTAYNINKITDLFSALLDWLFAFIPTTVSEYDSGVTYFPGDVCYTIEVIGGQKIISWYERTDADPEGTVNVPPTDTTRWSLLRSKSTLTRSIAANTDLDTVLIDSVYSCTESTETIINLPQREDTSSITGAFLLVVNSDRQHTEIISQSILYRDTGREYTRTLLVSSNAVQIIIPWYKSKEPVWSSGQYPKVSVAVDKPTGNTQGAVRGEYRLKIDWIDMDGTIHSIVTANLVGPSGPSGEIASIATETTNGLMSYQDKKKLNEMYKIGDIFITTATDSPADRFGGTWTRWGNGRVLVSVDETQTEFATVEQTGGEKTHILTISEMPNHRHTSIDERPLFNNFTDYYSRFQQATNGMPIGTETINKSTSYAGNSLAHNNLQPYITCYMWKRTA